MSGSNAVGRQAELRYLHDIREFFSHEPTSPRALFPMRLLFAAVTVTAAREVPARGRIRRSIGAPQRHGECSELAAVQGMLLPVEMFW